MKKKLSTLFALTLLITGCAQPAPAPHEDEDDILILDKSMYVYGDNGDINVLNPLDGETFSYFYNGDNIRIENGKIIALRANTETKITVASNKNRYGEFTVNVINRDYVSTHIATENKEGWFNEVNITKVDSMTSSFANGMDISSLKHLYDCGQKFYNKDGVETSLLYILKDAGVNWVRLRVWNDPKDTWEENGQTKSLDYGGGNCDKEHIAWIAHEAKEAGLKVLLNFHYSDFWTDPSYQILPKAWVNISTVTELAAAIKSYTKETLEYFISQGAKPDAVAIGNEIYSGLLIHDPGTEAKKTANGNQPYYSSNRTDRYNGLQARWNQTANKNDNVNLRTYIKAGIDAVNEVDPTIMTMLHTVKGLTAYNQIINFFKLFDDMDVDICGISAYSYYHFSNIGTLRTGMQAISNALPSKKIAIAETSYGFTYENDPNATNSFYKDGTCGPVSSYEVSIQGQAQIIRNTTEVVSNLSNGWGVFYWEGAWPPCAKAGWTDIASRVTWANQGLFSYNGKALGSLGVYNKMLGN